MSAPLQSASWYRVAGLKPCLRAHARLHRHRYRGELWYLLQDPASGRVHRFTPAARLVVAAMDGRRSVEELWTLAGRHLGEDAPTQDEMIQLLGQLHATDLLRADVTPDVAEIFDRGEKQNKGRRLRSYANPMAVRIPLWDPDAFLNRIAALIRPLWGGWGALLWAAVVLPALILVPPHWPELTHNFSDRVLGAHNLLLLWLVFPIIKALHELGHATAAKAGGGEVHDMGIMLLVLMPVPYVEASAATVFRSKYRRAVVGAAGMIVEVFIAAIAMYVWLLAEPGIARALAFNVMLVAGVSTLVFNGNPLLRYDAYYILADLIEIPNLAQRSLGYCGYLLERYLLQVDDAEAPAATSAEKAWFLFYGVASSIYRVLVTVAIALFIAGQFFVVGVILALWAVVAMAVLPLVKGLRHVLSHPRIRRRRQRALTITAGLAAALVLILFVVPAPFRSQAEGVIWLAEEATLRAGANGFLGRLVVEPGTRVARGDVLIQCYNPALEAQIRLGEAKVSELEATYAVHFVNDRAQAQLVAEQLASERAALARARERAAQLVVKSGSDGVFMAQRWQDMEGRYYHKGELLGYVTGRTRPLARVVVAQGEIDQVRLATDRVQIRMAQRLGEVAEGRIVRQVPAGEAGLPSRALATDGGGQIAVDPRDPQGTKAMERMFQFDVELEEGADVGLFGQRVHVRFDHRMEPLALQWYRAIRRLFLARFNV
ncbi:MAG: peptidase M50 [Rhodocyclaceae bacterium]|nr:peptidase M50 [Rhodocyclaceae bacterium]